MAADTSPQQALALAEQFPTPLFAWVSARALDAAERLRSTFDDVGMPIEWFYSYKTNYLPALCRLLHAHGFGAEVTCDEEWVLAAGMEAKPRLVVNGPSKSGRLLRAACEGGAWLVNLETDTDVDALEHAAGNARKPVRVGLRVSLPMAGQRGLDPSESWRAKGTSWQFGWALDGPGLPRALARVQRLPNVRLVALQAHLGGQIVDARMHLRAMDALIRLLRTWRSMTRTVEVLDLGGGFASGFVEKRRRGPLFELAQAMGIPTPTRVQREPELAMLAAGIRARQHACHQVGIQQLAFEPGRIVAEPAMVLVTRVVGRRDDGGRRHVVLDAGRGIAPSVRSDERRPIYFSRESAERVPAVLVGPHCHRGDVIQHCSVPTNLQVGDVVAIDAVGAYSLSEWAAHARRRPGVVDVQSGEWVWHPQTSEQFWAPVSPTPLLAET